MKLLRVRFREEHLKSIGVNLEGIQTSLSTIRENNPSWTWLDSEGDILACVGIVPIWSGLFEAWAIFSQITKYHPLRRQLVRDIKAVQKDTASIFGVRRCQSLVNSTFRDGIALVILLGYKKESEMPLYGPNGETFIRYVWFAKDHIK